MYIIKESNLMLYHGSPYQIETIDWKKVNYGIFWTSDSKAIALQYAKERHWVKSEFNYIYKINYSSVKIADLTDVKSQAFELARDWYEPTYMFKKGKLLDSQTFLDSYCDFGFLEYNPLLIKFLKSKKFDIIKIQDRNDTNSHVSYGFINKNKIVSIELVEQIKR